jgi:glucokinase
MTTHVTGQAAAVTASPAAQLSAHRRAIMDTLVGCPVITTAEYDRAMQRTLACQDLATLQKWYRNTVREIARREEGEPETAPIIYATGTQKEEIIRLANRHEIIRPEKTRVLLDLDHYDHAAATTVIGNLWAKILRRSGEAPPADGWSHGRALSYSTAA